jgi:ubiquinone/menaquinone biosynthesis C-methylase UbiE
MNNKILKMFQKVGMIHFFGDYFDGRFYVAYLLSKKHVDSILDIGCGPGIMLHNTNATLKIGLDLSFDSLKQAKLLDPKIELIQGDATLLPFKNNYFPNIIAMHLIPVVDLHQGGNAWEKCAEELTRISSKNSVIMLTGANRMSKHFEKTHTLESRKKYLSYEKQVEFFKKYFSVSAEGFGSHNKKILYALKFFYKFPDNILEKLGITKLIYRFLRSKKYLKDGRSYVIFCQKK